MQFGMYGHLSLAPAVFSVSSAISSWKDPKTLHAL